jgi:putative membrane protein
MNPPAPALMPMQANMIREPRQARGRAFDDLFVNRQVTGHEMALSLHENYASRGDAAALRRTAQAAVPIIQQHLRRAQQLD